MNNIFFRGWIILSSLFFKSFLIKFFSIAALIFSYSFLFGVCFNNSVSILSQDSISVIKLTFVGDLMCHLPQVISSQINKDSFDFKPSFKYIKKFLENSDITFGNLETVIGEEKDSYKGYPLFNSPPEFVEALKYAKFDILYTSNNHSFDQGFSGIIRTIKVLKANQIDYLGTYLSQSDYDSLRIINKKNFKIGLLAYTYGLNINLNKYNKYAVKIIDTTLIKKEIKKLKEKSVDIILVYFHFGDEYKRKPSLYQKEIVKKTIEYGADIIVASHPHVVQPIMVRNSSNNKIGKTLVAYSLGNFISNQRWRYSDAGVILNIRMSKNGSVVSFDSISIIPTWVYKGLVDGKNQFYIIPSDTNKINEFYFLNNHDKKLIKRSYYDTMEMFLKQNNK
ncbi:MAG: CapA family protein [Melioribacter sp.]|uniref:CapA family protein n=1 Tax=Rosettibacter primus TaxID=3111523 RepID=UPI00247C5FCB|nr:CapA family protein [Melioribacter sp.]